MDHIPIYMYSILKLKCFRAAQAASVPGREFVYEVSTPARLAPHPPRDRLLSHSQEKHPSVQARAHLVVTFLWVCGACMHHNSTRQAYMYGIQW